MTQLSAASRSGKLFAMLFAVLVSLPCSVAQEAEEILLEKTYTETLRYRTFVRLPADYETKPDHDWPLILFLHGGGQPKPAALQQSLQTLNQLPAIVVIPLCPPSSFGARYTNWNWQMLGEVVRQMDAKYRVDPAMRSVVGFSMGGSAAWELPSYEPNLFSKSVVIAGICHPWSLRHYPRTQVWVFSGTQDYMRKEQQETVTSARRFQVDVVETSWEGADHAGIFRQTMAFQPMLDWLVSKDDLRRSEVQKTP